MRKEERGGEDELSEDEKEGACSKGRDSHGKMRIDEVEEGAYAKLHVVTVLISKQLDLLSLWLVKSDYPGTGANVISRTSTVYRLHA